MPVVEVEGMVRVSTVDLAPEAIAGGGSGNSLYHATPGDGTWAAAPDDPTPDTVQLVFIASSLALLVQVAAVAVRFSSDGGANFGGWIVLPPGVHSIELDTTDVEVQTAAAANGAEYQIVAFA